MFENNKEAYLFYDSESIEKTRIRPFLSKLRRFFQLSCFYVLVLTSMYCIFLLLRFGRFLEEILVWHKMFENNKEAYLFYDSESIEKTRIRLFLRKLQRISQLWDYQAGVDYPVLEESSTWFSMSENVKKKKT